VYSTAKDVPRLPGEADWSRTTVRIPRI
jgi:hypothetical protein